MLLKKFLKINEQLNLEIQNIHKLYFEKEYKLENLIREYNYLVNRTIKLTKNANNYIKKEKIYELLCSFGGLILLSEELMNVVINYYYIVEKEDFDYISNRFWRIVYFMIMDCSFRVFNYPVAPICKKYIEIKQNNNSNNLYNEYLLPIFPDMEALKTNEIIILDGFINESNPSNEPLVSYYNQYYDLFMNEESYYNGYSLENIRVVWKKECDKYLLRANDDVDYNITINNSKKRKTKKVTNTGKFRAVDYYSLVDKMFEKANSSRFDEKTLINLITNEANPFALLCYFDNVINGQPFYNSLLPNILHILNDVEIDTGLIKLRGDLLDVVVICRFLMYFYGIGEKKDIDKAEGYLMINIDTLIKGSFLKYCFRLVNKKYLIRPLFSFYNAVELFVKYKEFVLKVYDKITNNYYLYDSDILTIIPFKMECIIKVILDNIVDANNNKPSLDTIVEFFIEKNKKDCFDKLVKESSECKTTFIDEVFKKIDAKKTISSDTQFYNNTLVDDIKSEDELNVLKGKVDDIDSMLRVANYYFNLGEEDIVNYSIAKKYYMIASSLGDNNNYYNIAICDRNFATKYYLDTDVYQKFNKSAMDILYEHAHTNLDCAQGYFTFHFQTNEEPSKEIANSILESILNNNTLSKDSINFNKFLYEFYLQNYSKAMDIFLEIFDYLKKPENFFILERSIVSFSFAIYNDWKKLDKTLRDDKKKYEKMSLKEQVEYTLYKRPNTDEMDSLIKKIHEVLVWAERLCIKSKSINNRIAFYISHGVLGYTKDVDKACDMISKNDNSPLAKSIIKYIDEEKEKNY